MLYKGGGIKYWTVLRPALFMANLLTPKTDMPTEAYRTLRECGVFPNSSTPLTPKTKLPLVDQEDRAKLAVAAFARPEQFQGKTIGLASDLLTPREIMWQLRGAASRRLTVSFLTKDQLSAWGIDSPIWMRYLADYVDMEELGRMLITPRRLSRPMTVKRLTTFKEFLDRGKQAVKTAY